MVHKLGSEQIIIESPMSFTGATKRIWPLMDKPENQWVKWLLVFPLVMMVLCVVYSFILTWYVLFGVLLIPFRLIRRSHRKGKKMEAQHREMMEAIHKNKV